MVSSLSLLGTKTISGIAMDMQAGVLLHILLLIIIIINSILFMYLFWKPNDKL